MLFRIVLLIFTISVSSYAIVDIAPVEVEGEKGLSGSISGSYTEKTGNTEKKEYEGSGKVQYEIDTTNLFFIQSSYVRTKSADVETEKATYLHSRFLHKLNNDSLYIEGFLQHQTNKYKDIDYRLLVGSNLRYKIVDNSDYGKLYLGIGLFEETIDYIPSSVQSDEDTLRVNTYIAYTHQISDSTKFNTIGYYQPSTETSSDEYSSVLAQLNIKIVEKLYLNFIYEWDYDSKPPVGIEKIDRKTKTAIMWEF